MGAAVLSVVVAMVAVAFVVASWESGAERHPTLPEVESAESAETSDESEDAGALVESVKRSGWEASSAGRREMCARMEDALRASTVLEYNMFPQVPFASGLVETENR
jgi:hypothetical protein